MDKANDSSPYTHDESYKAAGNSEPFKVSKGACHRARVQGAYVYTEFDNLKTYGSGQP